MGESDISNNMLLQSILDRFGSFDGKIDDIKCKQVKIETNLDNHIEQSKTNKCPEKSVIAQLTEKKYLVSLAIILIMLGRMSVDTPVQLHETLHTTVKPSAIDDTSVRINRMRTDSMLRKVAVKALEL
jgi:hypothetical protein